MSGFGSIDMSLGRRTFLQLGALAAGVTALGVTGCGSGGVKVDQLIHGATGGGLKDTLDPHNPVTVPDIARNCTLYEPLLRFSPQYKVEPCLAESYEHNAAGDEWTFKLRQGVTFHNGKPLTAEDVKASVEIMCNPQKPTSYMSDVARVIDLAACKAVDEHTYTMVLKQPYSILDQLVASYVNNIVPADFDPANPVGTGPYKYAEFVPGQRSRFDRFDGYWGDKSTFEQIVIMDFPDDTAKVNALLAGQVHSIDNLPTNMINAVKNQGGQVLISESGAWTPFTMRVDVEPFNDPRVREAMRLIVDREEMIAQAMSGEGKLANDLYSPFDDDYLGKELPQRHQDIEKAKFLLKEAGKQDLQVELVTSSGIGAGAVESANLFAQQAAKAGVQVRVNKVDSSAFYGEQYLSWGFAQDFWNTRNYLSQASACALPHSPYNECHFNNEKFNGLIESAIKEMDAGRRRTLIQDAQRIEYEEGGYIIWGFRNMVDGYSKQVTGFEPSREQPMSDFRFNRVRPA